MASVRKRGDKYEATAYLGVDHRTGKYRRKTFTRKTKSEARKLAEDLERKSEAGIDVSLGAMTFSELAPMYWQTKTTETQLSHATQYHYTQRMKELDELLGDIPFNKITSSKLRDAVYTANTPTMASMRLVVLRGIFKWAMEETPPLIEVNPMANVKAPAMPKSKPPVIYSVEELRKILDAAQGTILKHALYVQYRLALRAGELRGLRWQDIELFDRPTTAGKSGVATIQWQLPTQRSNLAGGEVFTPTKRKDKRELPIDAELARTLKNIRVEQNIAALQLGHLWHEMDLVFPRMTVDATQSHAGIPLSWPAHKNALKKILEKSGVGGRVSTHAFRHTCAAHMYSNGVSQKLVSKYLGHRLVSTTDEYYGHLVSDALDELPAALLRRA